MWYLQCRYVFLKYYSSSRRLFCSINCAKNFHEWCPSALYWRVTTGGNLLHKLPADEKWLYGCPILSEIYTNSLVLEMSPRQLLHLIPTRWFIPDKHESNHCGVNRKLYEVCEGGWYWKLSYHPWRAFCRLPWFCGCVSSTGWLWQHYIVPHCQA